MRVRITNDVYNIANRIKDIDKGYYVLYDTSRGNFEIHHSHQADTTYCVTLPYKTLDERALNYVLHTRVDNIENIIEDIDRENMRQENAEKTRVLSQFNDSLSDMLRRS